MPLGIRYGLLVSCGPSFDTQWQHSAISVCVCRFILALRSVLLVPEPAITDSASTSLASKLSRAVGNLGAPLSPFGIYFEWEGPHYEDKDVTDNDDDEDRKLILYSEDPLAAGLGLDDCFYGPHEV